MDSKRGAASSIGTLLAAALIAAASGAGGALATPDGDGAGGGQGGTATAVAGEGDTATAVPGEAGEDGVELPLPIELLDLFGLEEFAMARYVAQVPVGDDVAEDPNAHIDNSGNDGANVSVVGGGDEAVTATGQSGANGSPPAPETAETAEASATAQETLASPAVAGPLAIFGDRQ
ncbi:MAG: hypothetical protein ACRD0K_27480 [Egibacteraceae bacterium]